jgi:two-component system, LytTR family, response regulator
MEHRYKTLVIDDERPVRLLTKHVLAQYPHVFDVIGEAADGPDAVEQIDRLRPDLVFLDIQMPGHNGFEVLAHVSYRPLVVFLTAFDNYAIQAFETNGIDYLLKPLESERLEKTIQKLRQYQQPPSLDIQLLQSLLQQHQPSAPPLTTISVKVGNKILLLGIDEIAFLESKEKYTAIKTLQGKEYLDAQTLHYWESRLPHQFLRVQKGVIINTHHIESLERYVNNRFNITMKDKATTVLLSGHSYVNSIRERLGL